MTDGSGKDNTGEGAGGLFVETKETVFDFDGNAQ